MNGSVDIQVPEYAAQHRTHGGKGDDGAFQALERADQTGKGTRHDLADEIAPPGAGEVRIRRLRLCRRSRWAGFAHGCR